MSKEQFGAVPGRAGSDHLRLGRGHHRLLIVIAHVDRFGNNGRGCYLTHAQLADLARVRRSHATTYINDLVGWGYLSEHIPEDDRRRRVYRVIYTEEDRLFPVARPATRSNGRDRNSTESVQKSPKICPTKERQPFDITRQRYS